MKSQKKLQKDGATEQIAQDIGIDLTPIGPELISTMVEDDGENHQDQATSTFTETGTQSGIGTSSEGTHTNDDNINEEAVTKGLKDKHDKEEHHVATNFASKITNANKSLSQNEIGDLLNQHALSMQALRKKQEIERKHLNDKLEMKKQERLLKRRPQMEERTQSAVNHRRASLAVDNVQYALPGFKIQYNKGPQTIAGGRSGNVPVGKATIITSQSKDELRTSSSESQNKEIKHRDSFDSEDDFNDDESGSDEFDSDEEDKELRTNLRSTLQDDLWSKRQKMTSEDFKALLGAYHEEEEQRKKLRNAEKAHHREGLLSKLAANKRQNTGGHSGGMYDNLEEDSDEEELSPEQEQVIQKADAQFSHSLAKHIRTMSDEEFSELLASHLADVEVLKQMRGADRNRLNAKLQERLKNARRGDLEDEQDEAVERLTNKLKKKIREKKRVLDEEDIESLLQEYHRDRALLHKKHDTDRSRLNDKLKQKLEEKNRQKKQTDSTLGSNLFEKMQAMQRGGESSKEEFSQMLEEYFNHMEGKKRKRMKESEAEKEDKRRQVHHTASSLVKESHDQSKQINAVRQREREALNERLQRKLQQARTDSPT